MKAVAFLLLLNCLLIVTYSQSCASGQFFNGQRCAPCKANCNCKTEDTCDTCLDGYAFDSTFQNCLQCPQASDSMNIGCSKCCYQIVNTEFVCSQCASGSYNFLKGGQCIKIPGCTSIEDNGRCNVCTSGYYLKDGTCQACDMSCDTCYDNTLCLTCKAGYYNGTDEHNSLCQACPTGCATCTSSTMCQTCDNEYRLSGNICIGCPSNCKTCAAGGCSSCNTGAALISAACPLCTSVGNGGSAGCLTCIAVSSSIRCTRCDSGYYLTPGNTCDACTNKYANSALCTNEALIQCLNDFDSTLSNRYYKIDSQCIANTNNCKTMKDNTGKCSECYFESGAYYRLSSGVCQECVQTGCASYNSTSCSCLSCTNGYRYANHQCFSCLNLHCYECQSDQSTCQACAPHYGLSSSACISCTQSMCLNCDGDNSFCVTCENGYYLSEGTCYTCQASCQKCNSNTVCTQCASTHYLMSSGRCKSLPSNCIQVDQDGLCTKCDFGYQVVFGTCFACSPTLFNLNQCQRFCPSYYEQLVYGSILRLSSIAFLLLLSVLVFN